MLLCLNLPSIVMTTYLGNKHDAPASVAAAIDGAVF